MSRRGGEPSGPGDGRGDPVPLLDSTARATGTIEYLVDVRPSHMMVGAIARSRVTGASLGSQAFVGGNPHGQPVIAVDRVRYAGEPIAVIAADGLSRVVAIDLHTAAVEGCFAAPLEHLSAVPLLGEALGPRGREAGRALCAAARPTGRHRPQSGSEVRVEAIVGETRGRSPLIVDDMISTGGTIEAAARALLEAGCRPRIVVAASHLLLVAGAAERLARLQVRQILGTDSIAGEPAPDIRRASLAPLLAGTIARLHEKRSLSAS